MQFLFLVSSSGLFAFVDFVSISITETGSRNWSVRAVLVTQQECKVKDLKCTPDFDAFVLKPTENSSQAIWLLCDSRSKTTSPQRSSLAAFAPVLPIWLQTCLNLLTHFSLILVPVLHTTYAINPSRSMLHCSSVTWIYANGCLHMLISHIYIKLNSLLHCFLTLCPHMINFSDFFQNRY